MSHSLKLLLDSLFGIKNFRNEIVWCYTGPSGTKKNFPAKHDIILRYSKGEKWTFNHDRVRVEYKESFTMGGSKSLARRNKPDTDYKTGIEKALERGKIIEDYWSDIPSLSVSKERVGYPTQKPLALLRRIILASSNPGEWVLDPFCGCATTCLAAMDENRNWIGIDISPKAFELIIQRMKTEFQMFGQSTIHRTDIPKREVSRSKGIRAQLFAKQKGQCRGCEQEFYYSALELDHIVPRSKGGQDDNGNLQLLCGRCNRVKGDRPMAYLLAKMKDERAGV